MSFVLDTVVVSALMRGEPAVVRRLLAVEPSEVFVPQPVVAEIRYGLARLPRSRRRARLEERARELLSALPRAAWNDEVSARFGATKADLERRGERLEDFDVAIAAHALAADATLVTANVRDLGRIRGLRIEDWTE
jgi:tRNA(fMet)-specific endonuclease VapC